MSNHLAIATVTKAMRQILSEAVVDGVAGAEVLTERPDASANGARVHLFLYQVTPNPALRNNDLPTRNANGQVVKRPTAPLDLNYLLCFYGDDKKFETQRMLGAAVRGLAAEPGLTRQRILNAAKEELDRSNLADAFEQVKFTPLPLSLEELSKLWSIFFQTPYALSVAYQATVVLIESEEPVQTGQPVLQRGKDDHGIDTLLGPFPQLESIHVGEGASDDERLRRPSYPAARLGAIVTLRGRELSGDKVSVSFTHPRLTSPKVIEVPPAGRTVTQLKIAIPADAAAQTEWAVGIYSVTVIARRGDTERSSSALPLALAPQIAKIEPSNPVRDTDKKVTLTITCKPMALLTPQTQPGSKAQLRQPAVLLLADREVAAQLPALPDPPPAATDKLDFVIEKAPVVTGALARLRVDGVDSLPFKLLGAPPTLQFDPAQKVTIT